MKSLHVTNISEIRRSLRTGNNLHIVYAHLGHLREAEKRRLLLAKEVSLSPAQIQKAAQRLGLNFDDDGAATPAVAVSVKKAPTVSQGEPATHVKTIVINKPVKAVAPDNGPKVVKPESQAKRETVVKDKKG